MLAPDLDAQSQCSVAVDINALHLPSWLNYLT
jgi:hypothetical protein